MSSRAIRTLFRLCLRQAGDLERHGFRLEFRKPIDRQAWLLGKASLQWSTPSPAYNIDAFRALLPWVAEGVPQGSFSPAEAKDLIRHHFRHPAPAESVTEYIDRAITALRVLSEQVYLAECSSTCQTEGVVVEATAAFLGRESELDPGYDGDDGDDKNLYTYRVRVANVGTKTVQLLARHWVVTDSKGKTVEVPKWAGAVVGTRPTLQPQDCFEYYSRTDVDTREGTMHGAFQIAEFDAESGMKEPARLFEATIAPFRLTPPRS